MKKIIEYSMSYDFFQNGTKWIYLGIVLGILFSTIYYIYYPKMYLVSASINLPNLENQSNLDIREIVQKIYDFQINSNKTNEYCYRTNDSKELNKYLILIGYPEKKVNINISYLTNEPSQGIKCINDIIDIFNKLYANKIDEIIMSKDKKIKQTINVLINNYRTEVDYQHPKYWLQEYELIQQKSTIMNLKEEINILKKSRKSEIVSPEVKVEFIGPKGKIIFLNGIFSGIILGLLTQLIVFSKYNRKKYHYDT